MPGTTERGYPFLSALSLNGGFGTAARKPEMDSARVKPCGPAVSTAGFGHNATNSGQTQGKVMFPGLTGHSRGYGLGDLGILCPGTQELTQSDPIFPTETKIEHPVRREADPGTGGARILG